MDKKTAEFILSLIKEEELKNDELKKQAATLVADILETNESAAQEQTFNREQVQEQEQVIKTFCYFSFSLFYTTW
jgi:hypothetical protein